QRRSASDARAYHRLSLRRVHDHRALRPRPRWHEPSEQQEPRIRDDDASRAHRPLGTRRLRRGRDIRVVGCPVSGTHRRRADHCFGGASMRPRMTLAILSVSAGIACASLRPADQTAWSEDFDALLAHLPVGYANYEYAVRVRRLNVGELAARTRHRI